MSNTNAIPTPDLESMVRRKAALPEAQQFFDLTHSPNKAWLQRLMPGVNAAQRVLNEYMAQQTDQPPAVLGQDARTPEDVQRASLCAMIFGEGDLVTLERIVSSIKSNLSVRLDITLHPTENRTTIEATTPVPPKLESPVAPEPQRIEEPETGLIPSAPEEPREGIDKLFSTLKGRVRLDGGRDTPEDILTAVVRGNWSRKVAMLLPMYQNVNPHVVFSMIAQVRKQPWMGVEYEAHTVIQRARNILTQRFLRSEAEWSWWVDSDTIAPFGDAGFFFAPDRLGADPTHLKPEFASLMACERLLRAQKTIVGGVYQMRQPGGRMVIQPDLHPRNAADKQIAEELRLNGPQNKVMQVEWAATGCLLVHRSVYLAIMDAFPERQPENPNEPFDFFGHDMKVGSEDIAFCKLAAAAGHASHLDLAVWCGHMGNYSYFPTRK